MKQNHEFSGALEFRPNFQPHPRIAHVLFDFDGTLSLLRQGWPEIMVPMFVEVLRECSSESEDELRKLAWDDIMRLNGKQTIYQMIQLADRVRQRGGQASDPLLYKHEYLRRLEERIVGRKQSVSGGDCSPETFLVHGSRRALQTLADRDLTLHLASGTDEQFVLEEAKLLEIAEFFGDRIHGARDDYQSFSKQMIIDRILADIGGSGDALLAFGDGYVEIENTKNAGGLAVALATDEANNGSGQFDPWKRERLLGVGADVVIPDYRDIDALLPVLLGETAA